MLSLSDNNPLRLMVILFMAVMVMACMNPPDAHAHKVTKQDCIEWVKKKNVKKYVVWKRLIKRCKRKARRHNQRHIKFELVTASWYGPGFYGRTTACGQTYNSTMKTVAHKTMSCGTKLTILYKGRKVHARVADRGPYAHGRTFDLSAGTARQLGFSGVQSVRWSHGWN